MDAFMNTEDESHSTRLVNLFKPPTELIFQGDLDDARKQARNSKKYLLITVFDPSEFSCLALNRDLFNDEDVQNLIKEHFLFLYLYADSDEGKRHLMFYPIQNFPYIGILDPLTGERLKQWNVGLTPLEFQSESKVFF